MREKSGWGDYEIREGGDGKVGIYTRGYNCRLAVFNANTACLQRRLKALFDRAAAPKRKPKRRSLSSNVNPKARIGEKGYYAGPPMPTRP